MKEKILNELHKFKDLKNKEKIKSFVIFNLPSEKSYELNTLIRTEFLIIKEHLEKERKQELLKMIKKLDWIENKYSDLYHRYENTPVSRDILKWESEVYNDNYELVSQTQTPLKKLIDSFNFENIDFEEYNVNELLFDKMNSEMDFYNLKRYNSDKEFAKNYHPTESETKYMELMDYFQRCSFPKFIYCYNKEYQTDFEEWFRRGFKWDSLKWSVFGFDISQPEFESKASEYVLEEMYYNREIIYAT